jgi:PAS domain S-box-containing protein
MFMGPKKNNPEESEEWFKTLLDSAPDAMIIIDDAGQIKIANSQTEKMFGYDRTELQDKKVEMLLPERMRSRHLGHRSGFVQNPSVRPMGAGLELIARRKDGSEFPVEISLSPVMLESATFVSSVIRDVTERKKMEQEIIAAREAAERANKANSAFLAAASHDLRQPVQALSLLNGALRRTVKDERALEMIENQEYSLTAMTNLLNSLLDISRLDAGAIIPDFEEFPIQRLIDRLATEFTRRANHRGLQFTFETCGAMVRSDPNLLSEIIQNLVSNAIRYTDQGSVHLRCSEEGSLCCIEIEDTGIGIEGDQLETIFREFHQVKQAGSSKGGFGLGLAIVRRLAGLLKHRIDVESSPGKGSRFSIRLPIAKSQIESLPIDDPQEADDIYDAAGLIVLIEDDVNVAKAWGLLLEGEGYEVAMGASVAEASTLVEHLDAVPALIISDFHLLDGSNGVDVVNEIREYFGKNIPSFIVTGDTSKIVKNTQHLDNCTVMSKPVSTKRLLAAARAAALTGFVPED